MCPNDCIWTVIITGSSGIHEEVHPCVEQQLNCVSMSSDYFWLTSDSSAVTSCGNDGKHFILQTVVGLTPACRRENNS